MRAPAQKGADDLGVRERSCYGVSMPMTLALVIYVVGFLATFRVLANDDLGSRGTLAFSALWFLLLLAVIVVVVLDVAFCILGETFRRQS